jgi:hypothetical protein
MAKHVTQEQIDQAMRELGEAAGGVAAMLQSLGTTLIRLSSDLDHAFERIGKLDTSTDPYVETRPKIDLDYLSPPEADAD